MSARRHYRVGSRWRIAADDVCSGERYVCGACAPDVSDGWRLPYADALADLDADGD